MMTTQDKSWFDAAIGHLNDPQHQRVWSLIVSVFGDLAQGPSDRLSSATLTRIMQPMGVKNDAIRVALHRLRKDGWIDNVRAGRSSVHFLTDFGRAQSVKVSPRFYAPAPEPEQDWHILVSHDGPGLAQLEELVQNAGYVPLGRNIALGHGRRPAVCNDLLVMSAAPLSVPDALRDKLCPPELAQACQRLTQDISHALDGLPSNPSLTPSQIATIRALVVHRWRRVVLRHPILPADFLPTDWPEAACRQKVFEILSLLPRPAVDILEADRD